MYDARRSIKGRCDNHEFWKIPQARRQLCNIHIERLAPQDLHEASCKHGTLAFHNISERLDHHEPGFTAADQHS